MLPTLSTQRLALVPVADEHLEFEVEMDADREVMRYILTTPRTREQTIAAHKHRLELPSSNNPPRGMWVGSVDGVPVGLWMLLPAKTATPETEAELGYRLLPKFWGKGYATEGSLAVLEYAFSVQKLKRMSGLVMDKHEASKNTLIRLGFEFTQNVKSDMTPGHPDDNGTDVEFELTAEKWATLNSSK